MGGMHQAVLLEEAVGALMAGESGLVRSMSTAPSAEGGIPLQF